MGRENSHKVSELRRRGLALAAGCFLLVGLVVMVLLHTYQMKNEQLLFTLVEHNLIARHQLQSKDVQGNIQETEDLLEIVAAAYSSAGVDVDFKAWSGEYLDKVHALNDLGGVRYVSLETLEKAEADPGAHAAMGQVSPRLLEGKSVVSDVYPSDRLDGKGVFSVSVPILTDGRVVGALQSLLDAGMLLGKTGDRDCGHSHNCLIRSDGGMILGASGLDDPGHSLYDSLQALKTPREEVSQVREVLKRNSGEPVSLNIGGKGKMFLTASSLGYNDWVLVSLAYSHDIETYTTSMSKSSARLVLSLLAFLVLLLGTALWLVSQQRTKLLRNQTRYDLLARFSDTILFEYNCDERSFSFTPNIADRFDLPGGRKVYPREDPAAVSVVCPEDLPLLVEMFRQLVKRGGEEAGSVTIRLRDRDGEYRWINCQGQMIRDARGRHSVVIGKLLDVHEQKSIEARLLRKSSTDAMTGALNREAAQAQIEERLSARGAGFLFMLDVDNFKQVNDSMGHAVGDRLLVHFVKTAKTVFRQDDVVARIGGDEFVIFMSGCGNRATAARKARRLMDLLARWEESDCSVSIGVAAFPADGGTYDALYRAADAAMYRAKRKGKHGFCFADGTADGADGRGP